MGDSAVDDVGSLAMEREVDTRTAALQATEAAIRMSFDCGGTIWRDFKRMDGKPTCHNMPWSNAPDVLSCGARIEYQTAPGVYEIVPPDGRFAPDEVNADFLFRLGGGRRYRVSLRHKGNTVPHSYLTLDLTGRGDAHAFQHELAATPAKGAQTPAAAPAPLGQAESAAALSLGSQPVEALLGRAVQGIADPNMQLAFALLLRDSDREKKFAAEKADFLERHFQFTMGVLERATSQSGGASVAALLKANADAAAKAAADASARVRDLESRLHERELAAAKATGEPPSPAASALARGLEAALPAMAVRAMELVPSAAPAVVHTAHAVMAATAGAPPA